MDLKKELKDRLDVPENWDKHDYQTQRYSFNDVQEVLEDIVKKVNTHSPSQQSERFVCDSEEKGGSRCETQCLGCDGLQSERYQMNDIKLADWESVAIGDTETNKVVCHFITENGFDEAVELAKKITKFLNDC